MSKDHRCSNNSNNNNSFTNKAISGRNMLLLVFLRRFKPHRNGERMESCTAKYQLSTQIFMHCTWHRQNQQSVPVPVKQQLHKIALTVAIIITSCRQLQWHPCQQHEQPQEQRQEPYTPCYNSKGYNGIYQVTVLKETMITTATSAKATATTREAAATRKATARVKWATTLSILVERKKKRNCGNFYMTPCQAWAKVISLPITIRFRLLNGTYFQFLFQLNCEGRNSCDL